MMTSEISGSDGLASLIKGDKNRLCFFKIHGPKLDVISSKS